MTAYIGGSGAAHLAQDRTFLMVGSFSLLFVAVLLNIIGLNIGKWLQNAGGVGTYVPLLMLVGVGRYLWRCERVAGALHVVEHVAGLEFGTVNFWPQIAFAFAGFELCSAMSEEVRDPQKTFPRAIFGVRQSWSRLIYIAGTVAVLAMLPPEVVDPKSGVLQASDGELDVAADRIFGVIAAILVSIGNAGGVGSTVAGVARVPFVGGDRPLFAGGVRENSSEVEDAVGVDSGAGGDFGRDFLLTQVKRNANERVSDSGGCGHDFLFHSVRLHVLRGDQAGVPQGSRREQ